MQTSIVSFYLPACLSDAFAIVFVSLVEIRSNPDEKMKMATMLHSIGWNRVDLLTPIYRWEKSSSRFLFTEAALFS